MKRNGQRRKGVNITDDKKSAGFPLRRTERGIKVYDIKKIMKEISTGEGEQAPAVRFDLVMDNVPESQQAEIEKELKIFIEKIKGIAISANKHKAASGQEPTGGNAEKRMCYRNGKGTFEKM